MKDESGYFRVLETDKDHQFNMAFYCPGCKCHHGVNTERNEGPKWSLVFSNGKPTIAPSILVRHGRYTDPNDDTKYESIVCHLFIRNGTIEYLSDCTHELKGQTVEMQHEED